MYKLLTKRRRGRGGLGGRGISRQQYGGPPRGGSPHAQLQHGGPPEFQGRGNGPVQQLGSHERGGFLILPREFQFPGAGHDVVSSYGGPPSPPLYPELHQATPMPYQVPVSTPAAPHSEASSSQPLEVEVTEVEQNLGQLTIQADGTPAPPLAPPLRSGQGRIGKKTFVKANHFLTELTKKDLHQYDVIITPEVTYRVKFDVMRQLVKLYRDSHLGKRLPAYDGCKSLYTAGKLPFPLENFTISVDDGSGKQREREFKVEIKWAGRADLHHLEVLHIVLPELLSSRYLRVGKRSYLSGRMKPLGEGMASGRCFYQSIRPTEMGLSLNADVSTTAFIESVPVIEFVTKLLNRDFSLGPPSVAERATIIKGLRGIKVEVPQRGKNYRKYRVADLTSQATSEVKFPVDKGGTMKFIVDYFFELGIVLKHTQWPCLLIGNPQSPNYLPMEVCKIVDGQRSSKRLNEEQISALWKMSCLCPLEREQNITQTVKDTAYHEGPYVKEFGIKVSNRPVEVEARVLPAPRLKYNDTGIEKDCLPRGGHWNMINKKMYNGGSVKHWLCVNFSSTVEGGVATEFCFKLASLCHTYGMEFESKPVVSVRTARPDQILEDLIQLHHDARSIMPKDKGVDLLIAILPNNNGSLYGDLKRICETNLGVVSQCCLTKHVFQMDTRYLSNIALKINVKVGGRNTVLVDAISEKIPLVTDTSTIIFGADVSHPEDSRSPSIAAVVASQDWPEITKYAGLVCAQAPHQELIQDLFKEWQDPVTGETFTGGMIKELLISFSIATGQFPERIIFYRDGVGEGQFYQVLLFELDAIQKACASINSKYQPPVTFVVVQKRHHTRLFARNHQDKSSVGCNGNILPGTVVDSKICHATEFDFYLCSHASNLGTSRPAHYHVLWDDNYFSPDGLQTLTHKLCYTYARRTNSLSIVPPAYYAHLAASRGRFYMEPESSDSGSMTSGAVSPGGAGAAAGPSTRAPEADAAVRPLLALKDNVKKVMFYC